MGKDIKIYYFSSTHWDREWYQTFQGFRYRLVSMMNDLIYTLDKNQDFGVFHFDGQTIILEDYIEIEPEKRTLLKKLIGECKLIVGPWYVMPDEFLLSGESLIKNLIIGHHLAKEWGSEAWKYGYICDVFGHIAQMPQIFNGFGIKYSLLGRGTNEHNCPAHFIWQSPDGSQTITFKVPDESGYGSFCLNVIGYQDKKYKDINSLYPKIKEYIENETQRSSIPVVVIMDAMDHEAVHGETPKMIEMIKEMFPKAEVYHKNLELMGNELVQYKNLMPVKLGELNETGKRNGGFVHLITHTLSSRYPIKQANDICQILLEKWVEPLTAITALRGLDINKSYAELAYKYLIKNHPHDSICGCSIDQVHKDMEFRFDQAKMISSQLLDEIFNFERNQHSKESDKSSTRLLLLWNPLPFSRKEAITVDIDFNTDYPCKYREPFGYEEKNSFKIYNSNGQEIPYGLVGIKKDYNTRRYNQYVEKTDIYTISMEVTLPPCGIVEYKIIPFKNPSRYLKHFAKSEREVENQYINLKINDNGTLRIHDKIKNIIYDQLLSYVDDGEIGDGWYHVNPVEDRIITSIGAEHTIERVENGPVRTVFKIITYLKVPKAMDYHSHGIRRSKEYNELKIISLVGLSKKAKCVDIETTVINNVRDHRLKVKLPTNVNNDSYFANQPFAFVQRKVGVKEDTQDWKECDVIEKQMSGIVGKRNTDGNGLAFISSYGLHECAAEDDEDGSLLVTLFRSFGKTVMTNGEDGGQIQGELKFKYCLMPIQNETTYADLLRMQDCLQTTIKGISYKVDEKYVVSEPRSFFEIISGEVCMSILKRPEDSEKNKIIIRLYNPSDRENYAEIKLFKTISEVEEVNLNEEYIENVSFDSKSFTVKLASWKIKTYSISIK